MELNNITYTLEDRVAHIQFTTPNKYNIYTSELEQELISVWDDISAQPDIRGVIFSGYPTAFLTGYDLRNLNIADINATQESTRRVQELFNRIQNFSGPTIAVIDGYATGTGLELALACDFRFASENAVFSCPETKVGLIPSIGGTQRLPRLIGIEQAKLMIFTGKRVYAKEAKQIGLISRIIESQDLLSEAFSTMDSILQNAPVAISTSKMCINFSQEMSLEQGLALERSSWLSLCATDDVVEGIDAFLNKRTPNFSK